MTDKIDRDVVELSEKEYRTIADFLSQNGCKMKDLLQSTYIPLPSCNIHVGKKHSYYYEFQKSYYQDTNEEAGYALIILDNSVDNWGLIFDLNSRNIKVFKHTKGEHKRNPEAMKKAANDRQFAISLFFVVQHYLKRLPEAWIKKKVEKKLSEKEVSELKKAGKKRVRKVKLINHYTFSVDELERRAKEHDKSKVFLCPCWGVRGHQRHLKNGKVVWIHAYRKGAKRNEENVYESKTYCA